MSEETAVVQQKVAELEKQVAVIDAKLDEMLNIWRKADGVLTFIKWLAGMATVVAASAVAIKELFFPTIWHHP